MIKCLSKEVQGKLRSGIAIFSLQQCLEELILNSIDASATCVGVRVDIEAFKVQVIDNGSGMDIEDMESVGNRYFTSKCSSLEDLDNLKFYGFRGEAVASIANLAMLVEISSRTKMSVKTHVKVFKDGKGLDVFEAETTRPSAGTTVVICNFFHNMPVRRNRMDSVLEFERIRQRVEAISLIHPSVSFTLKNDCTGTMVVQLSKARNTYYRFVQIHGLGRAQKLGEINHSHAQFEVSGYVGREGHYNNTLQFLYVNDRLLLKTRIHKLLNLLLRKVGSSSRQNDSPGTPPAIRSPKQRRGAELHAMYVINIMCHYSEYDICLEPAKTLIEFKDWESILFCIEEAVKAFLTRENLVSEISPEDIQDYICKNVFSGQTASTDRVKDSIGKGAQTHMEGVTLECNVGKTLASELVHRRQIEDSDKMNSVYQTCDGVESEQGDRVGKLRDKEVLTGFEQEQEYNTTNPQCRPSSVDTDQGLQYDSITDSSVTDSSESYKEVTKENESNEHLKSAISCPESSQHSLIFKTKEENLKMSIEEGTEMKDNAREHVSLSRCTVRAPCTLTQGIQSEMGSIKQTLPQPQDTELNPGGHRNIFLSHPYIHSSLPSQKCLSHQSRKGLALESREKLATKRKWPMVEGPGHLHVYNKESKDLPTGIPSKISTFMSCQKLALYKEVGSLDRFRRIYGKLTKSNPVPVDVNSNYLAIDATASQTEHLVMNAKAVLPYLEADQERDVTESRLDLMKDHKSPLTLSMFTKLKYLSARSSEISLATKLSHLKHQRTEVATSAFVHPPETTSNEDICPQDTVENNAILDINNGEQHNNTGRNRDFIPGCSTNPLPDEKEANNVTASCDWLHHYDDTVGKLVYINKVTGLSKYEAPSAEETQVSCTSDVTNMAISVISKKGIEYRCYPFQMDLVLPFLPKSKSGRVLSSGPDNRDGIQDSNSLSSLYSEWTNPVFARPPMVGVDISSVQAEGLAVKIHNILFPYRFSKDMIHSMKVIHQVDKKFLACLINTQDQEPVACSETDGNLLVLVDQHAAHERVRLENLVADSYEDDPETPGERRLCSSTVAPPLEVSVTEEELRLLRSCRPSFRGLGLEMQFSQIGDPQVLVGKVPMCFTEKESNELRRGRRSIIKPIVEEYLQEQIELLRSTGRVRGTLPLTVLKVLASLACHGAIKFNDRLSKEECCSLVGALSSCQLPFQCAHGRPSIAPLVDVLHLNEQEEPPRPNLRKLRRMYKAWELYGNR